MKKGLWVKGAVLPLIIVVILSGNVFAAQEDHEKILRLKDQIVQIQNEGKLGMRNVNLYSKVITLGAYVPLPEAKIEVDKKYYIYYEPTNWFTRTGEGRYEIWLEQEVLILDVRGNVLWESLRAPIAHFNTATPVLDVYVVNDLSVTAAPLGKYTYKIVLHDEFKEESVTETVDFEVVK